MNRLIPVLVGTLLLSVGIAAAGGAPAEETEVAVTFHPLQSMTSALMDGTGLRVTPIIPPGTEPHSFDPSPSDIQAARSARIYIAAGAGLAVWEHELLESDQSQEGPTIARTDSGIEFVSASGDHDHQDEAADDQGTEESHNRTVDTEHADEDISADPHYWVSPRNAVMMAGTIRDALIERFPEHRTTIEQNHQEYSAELETLEQDYRTGLSDCRKDTILTTHAAYSYLAEEYGFEQVTMLGSSPVSEPTPRQIQRLITTAEQHDLRHVFYERGMDSDTAQTIADQIGASTLSLNPVLGGDGSTYVEAMRMNLENLRTGMECR